MRPLARPQRDGVSQPARRRRTVHQPAEESVMEGSQRGRQKRAFQGETGYKRTFYRVKVTKGNTPQKVKKHICPPGYSTVLGGQSGDSGRGRGCTFKWPNWKILCWKVCVYVCVRAVSLWEWSVGCLLLHTTWQTVLYLIMYVNCWQSNFLASEEKRIAALQIQNCGYFS